ncbi:MAG: sigma 54-interacting transcriptional regulator [Pseudomonadota bacterium]
MTYAKKAIRIDSQSRTVSYKHKNTVTDFTASYTKGLPRRIEDIHIFRKLGEHIPVIVGVYSSTRYLYVNQAWERLLGYTLDEMLQKNFWDIIHPDDMELVKKRGRARLRGEKVPNNYELRMLTKDGRTRWLTVFFAMTSLDNKNIGIVGAVDITESKRLKEELQVARDELEMRVQQRTEELNRMNKELTFLNQNLNSVLQNMSDTVITVNRYGDLNILNPFFDQMSDTVLAEIKNNLKNNILADHYPFIKRMLDDRQSFRDEELILPTQIGPMHFVASGTPILNEQGIVESGVVILRPIKDVHRLVNRFSGAQASFRFEHIITNDPVMLELTETAKRAASSMSSVLIEGESGTGKELFAQAIHNYSPRNKGPFLAVNCGAIPRDLVGSELFGYSGGAFTGAKKGGNPGKFELASGGTLFLDEIGDMPLEQQAALLRVIQEKTVTRIGGHQLIPVDARIICATNKDLFAELRKGNFRNDLYYRLNVISIKIPPLRERRIDITLIFKHFLNMAVRQFNKPIKHINDGVLDVLSRYNWPGNVRELQNVVERMVNSISGSSLEIEHLPSEIRGPFPSVDLPMPTYTAMKQSGLTLKEAHDQNRLREVDEEKNRIIRLLGRHNGNISSVAREMGISRTTLYKKMQTYRHEPVLM